MTSQANLALGWLSTSLNQRKFLISLNTWPMHDFEKIQHELVYHMVERSTWLEITTLPAKDNLIVSSLSTTVRVILEVLVLNQSLLESPNTWLPSHEVPIEIVHVDTKMEVWKVQSRRPLTYGSLLVSLRPYEKFLKMFQPTSPCTNNIVSSRSLAPLNSWCDIGDTNPFRGICSTFTNKDISFGVMDTLAYTKYSTKTKIKMKKWKWDTKNSQ